ncbi:TPA: hypothetical protein IAA86_08775 [Candidatus Galligastranaerophilus intestinavium]|uniref:Uncharacterized protein n=1 Tax=Candidatus Galligastranaerophilus intestinavium TaxID=2840836 RepID=A0A9D1JYD6_9BACT|nr:hypothetical protein [Candidatus Galligastranaerophilus intestinavium]
MNFKNFKIVRKLANISPKLKWFMYKNIQDYKIGSKYIDYLIPDEKKSVGYDNDKLEKMVRETLAKEFSPKIKESKSYELLVDAVMHNLKKKQLEAMGALQDIDEGA